MSFWLASSRTSETETVKAPLVPIWNGGARGILYRVAGSATAASDTPNGSGTRPTR